MLAEDQALEQRCAFPRCALARRHRPDVILQAHHVRVPLLEAQVARMMIGQEDLPLVAIAPFDVALVCERVVPCGAAAIAVHASVNGAHYGEFVQWERRKANGQFGVTRTVVSVMPSGLEQRWHVEAMSMVDVQLVG